MALWNTEDNFASVPAYLQPKVTFDGTSDVAANGTFTIPAHPYENGDKVKYTSTSAAGGFTSGTDYFVVARTADTLQLEATVGGGAIARGTANGAATDSLQQVAGVAAKGEGEAYFIDVQESGAVRDQGLGTAGWNTYYTYNTSDGTTRHKAECLVAAGQTATAAGDNDSIGAVSISTFVTQPVASDGLSVAIAQGESQTFTVLAENTSSEDAVFTYYWNTDTDSGPGTSWNVVTEANTPGFELSDAGRSLTINVPNDTSFDGKQFRVDVVTSFPGGSSSNTITSHSFVLSVS